SATDLEHRAPLREVDRRVEAVRGHDRVAGQATRAAFADRAAAADRLRAPGRGAAVNDCRPELSEPLTPLGHLGVALCLVRGHTVAAAVREHVIRHLLPPFGRGRRGYRPFVLMTNG